MQEVALVRAYLVSGEYPPDLSKDGDRSFRRKAGQCFLETGVLYMRTLAGIRDALQMTTMRV